MRKVELVAQARRTARSLDSLTVCAAMLTDVVRQAGAVGEPWEPRGMRKHRFQDRVRTGTAAPFGVTRTMPFVVASAGHTPRGGKHTDPYPQAPEYGRIVRWGRRLY